MQRTLCIADCRRASATTSASGPTWDPRDPHDLTRHSQQRHAHQLQHTNDFGIARSSADVSAVDQSQMVHFNANGTNFSGRSQQLPPPPPMNHLQQQIQSQQAGGYQQPMPPQQQPMPPQHQQLPTGISHQQLQSQQGGVPQQQFQQQQQQQQKQLRLQISRQQPMAMNVSVNAVSYQNRSNPPPQTVSSQPHALGQYYLPTEQAAVRHSQTDPQQVNAPYIPHVQPGVPPPGVPPHTGSPSHHVAQLSTQNPTFPQLVTPVHNAIPGPYNQQQQLLPHQPPHQSPHLLIASGNVLPGLQGGAVPGATSDNLSGLLPRQPVPDQQEFGVVSAPVVISHNIEEPIPPPPPGSPPPLRLE